MTFTVKASLPGRAPLVGCGYSPETAIESFYLACEQRWRDGDPSYATFLPEARRNDFWLHHFATERAA